MSTVEILPRSMEPGDYECPTCGPVHPKRLFGKAFHCMLCGEECRVRRGVLAALAHAARPDVIGPFEPPPGIKPGQRYVEAVVDGVLVLSQPHADFPASAEPTPVRGAPPARYGCHNRPDKSPTYLAQDGYGEPFQDGFKQWFQCAKYVVVHHRMSEDCRYDKRHGDSKCAECRHKGEKPE